MKTGWWNDSANWSQPIGPVATMTAVERKPLQGTEKYDVVMSDGEVVALRTTTPEKALARFLKAKGETGKATLRDGKTGMPRMFIDIVSCAAEDAEEAGVEVLQ
jgi:hypothetical protein